MEVRYKIQLYTCYTVVHMLSYQLTPLLEGPNSVSATLLSAGHLADVSGNSRSTANSCSLAASLCHNNTSEFYNYSIVI
jgi:hypothetical protein